jgi:hypothetical protein
MSFQAYLDAVKAKTGKTPEDFRVLVAERGLVKHGEIVAWLKADYGLGHGHANAVTQVILHAQDPHVPVEEQVANYFQGGKARWRAPYEALLHAVKRFGADVQVAPTTSYLSLVRQGKKFAILAATAERLDLGIKRKGVPAQGRFEEAGAWNAMVTHRVRIHEPGELDEEVLAWLQHAYEQA